MDFGVISLVGRVVMLMQDKQIVAREQNGIQFGKVGLSARRF